MLERIKVLIQTFITNRRVARGALLLDGADTNWFKFVNARSIDMASPYKDVLGQWKGHYSKGLQKLHIVDGWRALQYGFVVDRWSPAELLNHKWGEEMKKRPK